MADILQVFFLLACNLTMREALMIDMYKYKIGFTRCLHSRVQSLFTPHHQRCAGDLAKGSSVGEPPGRLRPEEGMVEAAAPYEASKSESGWTPCPSCSTLRIVTRCLSTSPKKVIFPCEECTGSEH